MGKSNIEFEQVIDKGCGLDVHRDTVVATVMGKGIQQKPAPLEPQHVL